MTVTEDILALQTAVSELENELGLNPSTVYANVRARLDIIEKRINSELAPLDDVDDTLTFTSNAVTISTGSGEPTSVGEPPGSLYLRTDGYVYEGLYAYRSDGYWHRVDTDPWTAAGDLSGTYNNQTVIGLQGRDVADDSPNDGYLLTWNNSATNWEPQRSAISFYPLNDISSTNLISNKGVYQSPIPVDGYSGIINLGNDNSQNTNGVIANYGIILGGNENEVREDFGVVIGGSQGLAKFTGQHVHSVRSLTGSIGDSQYSRIILDGYADAGVEFDLTLPSTSDGYLNLDTGKSYSLSISILVAEIGGTYTQAQFKYDILCHVNSGGVLILDNVNNTLIIDNGTSWSIDFPTPGTNQFRAVVSTSGGVEDRRALAVIDCIELSGL